MLVQSLFNIVLKVLGIYFVKDIILTVPSLLSVFYSFGDGDTSGAIATFLISLLTLFIYCIVTYLLIFRSEWIIEKLRLCENMPEDPIPLNIHRSTIVSIAILAAALYLITQAIPLLIRGLTKWYQYAQVAKGFFNGMEPFDYSIILVYAAEIVIGLLMIGYQPQLVSYIELQRRKGSNQSIGSL
jgi:hypothetical protein